MNGIDLMPDSKPGDNLIKLIDTISLLHHQVLRQKLASLNRAIQRIATHHVVPLSVMDRFERQFLAMADNLESNMEEQECWLFAWLRRMVKREPGINNYLGESLEEAIAQAATADQESLDALGRLQMCLCHPEWADKGLLVEELTAHLRDLEEELTEYDRLERQDLFPSVRKFCQSCRKEEETNHAY